MSHPIPQQIGRYTILGVIKGSGMGRVYKARQPSLLGTAGTGRVVALKVMGEAEGVAPQDFFQRFAREVEMLASLSHPNIVSLFDWGEHEGRPYLVMEFVEGRSLADMLLQKGALDPASAANYGRQIAAALAAAHRKRVVHRDIKPANILINTEGAVKVVDFGIGRLTDDAHHPRLTRVGVLGTPEYISPEQAQGQPGDSRSDLYSLGVVLYEALVGRPPFEADGPVALLYAHVHNPPVPPSERRPGIPRDLEQIVMRLLEKDPDRRYQDAHEVEEALRQPLGPAVARPRPAPRRAPPTRVIAPPPRKAPPAKPPRPPRPPRRPVPAARAPRRGPNPAASTPLPGTRPRLPARTVQLALLATLFGALALLLILQYGPSGGGGGGSTPGGPGELASAPGIGTAYGRPATDIAAAPRPQRPRPSPPSGYGGMVTDIAAGPRAERRSGSSGRGRSVDVRPEPIRVTRSICPRSGQVATQWCPPPLETKRLLPDQLPGNCTLHRGTRVAICTETNRRANRYCPSTTYRRFRADIVPGYCAVHRQPVVRVEPAEKPKPPPPREVWVCPDTKLLPSSDCPRPRERITLRPGQTLGECQLHRPWRPGGSATE